MISEKSLEIFILLFYSYSFLGWLMESVRGALITKKFVNRGFFIGPFCPIYGFGGCGIFLLLNKYSNDPLLLFILSIIICSILEYFTSYVLEKIFKNRWWDYSNKKFNLNGRICLEYAIPFGIGSVLVFYILNPCLINLFININNNFLRILCITLFVVTLIDMIISFNIIFTLKNISSSINCDSTEEITKEVKKRLINKSPFHKRIIEAFPNMKIYNTLFVLKEKLKKYKEKIKQEKKS